MKPADRILCVLMTIALVASDAATAGNTPEETRRQAGQGGGHQAGGWIDYELSEPTTLDHIKVAGGRTQRFFFEVHTSLDGESWQRVFEGESWRRGSDHFQTQRFDSVETRFVRIVAMGRQTANRQGRFFVSQLRTGDSAHSQADAANDLPLTFLATADPQINVPKWGTAGTEKTIDAMNRIAGTSFPFGGKVGQPEGVIVAGDLVDALENPENWERYKEFYDPRGKARLRFPVYEGIGNHDLTSKQQFGGFNPLQREFVARNQQRPGELIFCENHYHYAWQWAGVHFVQLNLFPGNTHRPVYDRRAPWNDPKHSLEFLKSYLGQQVGDNDAPVVLTWHYGLRGWGLDKWWTTEDLDHLEKVIKGNNIILILHGHEHSFARYQWRGYDVIMSPSPQHDRDPKKPTVPSEPKGFLVFRITQDELQMGHRTVDGWTDKWSTSLTKTVPR